MKEPNKNLDLLIGEVKWDKIPNNTNGQYRKYRRMD